MKKLNNTLLVLMLFQFALLGQELEPDAFDFWVGEWEASWDEGDGKKGFGTNKIEKILDGKVIRENFEISEGKSKGFKGTSISVFNPQKKEWHQAWADNNGGYYDFYGIVESDKRIFQTHVFDLPDDVKFIQRMIFYNITKNSMTWDWESSKDGGDTWNLNWRIYYTK
ncbi:MAG: hypothetical protein AAF363_08080 [Bacteroidota bacterium]